MQRGCKRTFSRPWRDKSSIDVGVAGLAVRPPRVTPKQLTSSFGTLFTHRNLVSDSCLRFSPKIHAVVTREKTSLRPHTYKNYSTSLYRTGSFRKGPRGVLEPRGGEGTWRGRKCREPNRDSTKWGGSETGSMGSRGLTFHPWRGVLSSKVRHPQVT